MLPLGPIGPGNSPYQSPSSFAGNELLISPQLLLEDELLTADDLRDYPTLDQDCVDFDEVRVAKRALLERAFSRFDENDQGYQRFIHEQASWLDDYSLFIALKEAHNDQEWFLWERGIAMREQGVARPLAMAVAREPADQLREVCGVYV